MKLEIKNLSTTNKINKKAALYNCADHCSQRVSHYIIVAIFTL